MAGTVIAVAFFALCVASVAGAEMRVLDLEGRSVDPLALAAGVRGNAFVFTTTDCPIANRYAPEVERLHAAFASQGIRFWLVYVNPRESVDAIRSHVQKFGYTMPVLRDVRHDLIKTFGVTVTPEAVVVDTAGSRQYRGRIDDRYAALGVQRSVVTQHDFRDALSGLLKGVSGPKTTPAFGCVVEDFAPVTFAGDIAALMFDRCATCHRSTGAAPFSLLTYAEVRQRASQIAAVTRSRYMPPWKATSDGGPFVGHKPLSEAEISTITRWVDEGAVEGDRTHLPPPPTFAEGWQLGQPDLIVTTAAAFTLKAEASDVFRIFAIRLPIESTKYVTGIEFHPGNARVVHHANIRLDHSPASRQLDERDPLPGYDGLMARSAVYPEGHFLGWTPGQIAPLVPENMAWRLEPGTDLVVQLHLQPSGATEAVQPVIGLFFGQTPPTRTPTILRLGSQGIDIAPDDPGYGITDSYTLPVDVELQAVQPHAHYRLREVTGLATLPDGTTRSLIDIGEWDFRWQHVYRYATPMALPKGTRLSMLYRYDNSATNPRNPQLPPQRVLWGQRSVDEMGDLWFQFVTRTDADRVTLSTAVQQKMTDEDIVGYETMLRADPRDAELHDDVAVLYLARGRARRAADHFRASAALRPRDAAAHFNLATALSVAGDFDDAIAEYRAALTIRPDYGSAHNNLGTVLAAQGHIAEAVPHFRQAARVDATNVQAHRHLAWYIATSAESSLTALDDALAAAERAAQLTGRRDASVLDTLAAVYAARGEYDAAIAMIDQAISLSREETPAREMRGRRQLYRERRPYRVER